MTYKKEFSSRVKGYFADSVDKAEEINRVWTLIGAYFEEISNIHLKNERKLLGEYIVFECDEHEIEFAIRGYGLRFKKGIFDIEVHQILGEDTNRIVVIDCDNHKFEFGSDIDKVLDKYVSEYIEKRLA